jgi:hypothetical protein
MLPPFIPAVDGGSLGDFLHSRASVGVFGSRFELTEVLDRLAHVEPF